MEKVNEIINIINKQKIIRRILIMTFALFLSALVFNILLIPTHLTIGGTAGVAIITDNLFGVSPAIVLFCISFVALILGIIFLEKDKILGAAIGTVLYPLFVELTSDFSSLISIASDDLFIFVIFIGALLGLANGLIYKSGLSAGGLPLISQIVYKYYRVPISKTNLVMNAVIILIGGFFLGWDKAMYAIIIIYIDSIIIDKVLLGISTNKAFYIITSEEVKIKEYIINEMKHSVTIFDVKGAFLEKKRKVLLTVIPSREYFKVTEGIKLIDENAFFLVTDAYQVEGGK